MPESVRQRYCRWCLEALLLRHPDLRIVPSSGDDLILAGTLAFCLAAPNQEPIDDRYGVELRVPADFPRTLPNAPGNGRPDLERIPQARGRLSLSGCGAPRCG